MKKNKWMIYGATGHTGQLIVGEAVKLGQKPLLAGRSPEKLRSLAEKFGLEWVAFDLINRVALIENLNKVDLVLQCAGPFTSLAPLMIDACLETCTHYTDIANEIPVFNYIQEKDDIAKKRNVALVSGIGFGVVATNCLLKLVSEKLPDATHAEVCLHIESVQTSVGAKETGLSIIKMGGKIRKNGKLVSYRLGAGKKSINFGSVVHSATPLPLGDLEAAWMATRIPNIKAYGTAIKGGIVIQIVLALIRKLLWLPFIRKAILNGRSVSYTNPRSQSWAKVTNTNGKNIEASMVTSDGYKFTACAASQAIISILDQNPSGALAPATILGSDFLQKMNETKVSINEKL